MILPSKARRKRIILRTHDGVQSYEETSTENEPYQIFPGVSSGKFLRFIVTSRGIHLDLNKVKAIREMQLPPELNGAKKDAWHISLHLVLYLKHVRSMPPFKKLMKRVCHLFGMKFSNRHQRYNKFS